MNRFSNPSIIEPILPSFGLHADDFTITPIGSGYIHQTYKLAGEKSFILQRINNNVFARPDIIANNIRTAADFLKKKDPAYPFLTPLRTIDGDEMANDSDGFPWRLYPYFENTFTIDRVTVAHEAFSAAAAFGKLTRMLHGADTRRFRPTIERFHDLEWRWQQFEESIKGGRKDRLSIASDAVEKCHRFKGLVDTYTELVRAGELVVRITHNDTKINNVLFDASTREAVCAIDLDTLMPGFFIYDVGDMIRTFVSPVDEEERDLSRVTVRKEILKALVDGYYSEMGEILTGSEKSAIGFSGKMMTYIMALRMLTDYLNGDVYYITRYDDQNLVRAQNQLKLLRELHQVSL